MGALVLDCVQFPGWSPGKAAALTAQPQPHHVLSPKLDMHPAEVPTLLLFHSHFLACNAVLHGDAAHIKNTG